MQFSIKNLIAVSAVLGFFFAFYSKYGVGPAIFAALLLAASFALIIRVKLLWGESSTIKRGWILFSATFMSFCLAIAVYGLLFGELNDESLARSLRNSCNQIDAFKDISVRHYYGKGTETIRISGSLPDMENANRLGEMLKSSFNEERKHGLVIDVEILSTGERWRFHGGGPIDYGLRHLSQ